MKMLCFASSLAIHYTKYKIKMLLIYFIFVMYSMITKVIKSLSSSLFVSHEATSTRGDDLINLWSIVETKPVILLTLLCMTQFCSLNHMTG